MRLSVNQSLSGDLERSPGMGALKPCMDTFFMEREQVFFFSYQILRTV